MKGEAFSVRPNKGDAKYAYDGGRSVGQDVLRRPHRPRRAYPGSISMAT